MLQPTDSQRRLFVDPASKSSGWALYKGILLIDHGTIEVFGKNVFDRLCILGYEYDTLAQKLGEIYEVHIEQLVRNTHIYTHYSVGIIGAAFSISSEVSADIPIQSWQKATNWKTDRSCLAGIKVGSEDELAAIAMGVFWTRRYLCK